MQLLRYFPALLLDLPVRFSDLQHVHGRKPLGLHLQWSELAVPRLWGAETVLNDRKDRCEM